MKRKPRMLLLSVSSGAGQMDDAARRSSPKMPSGW
jgi:hypothetical protein